MPAPITVTLWDVAAMGLFLLQVVESASQVRRLNSRRLTRQWSSSIVSYRIVPWWAEIMIVVFDLDFTLVDRYGTSVRPGMEDLLLGLTKAGHGLALWTAASRFRTENIFAFYGLDRHFEPIVCKEDPLAVEAAGHKDIRL
jgi:hypothetical protein